MAETQRLGLEMFGGFAGGSIADRDYKFSTRDRQILDAFLQALEGHRHTGGSPLENPTTLPTLTLNPTGSVGQLPGGQDLFYVVSYVDEWGLESGMSLEASVATPDPFPAPPAPAVTPVTGGTLVAGTYYYQITYTQAGDSGEVLETLASPTTVVTLAGPSNHTARVSLPPVPSGSSGWRVYRLGQNDPYAFLVHTETNTASTHWDDTGAVPATSTTPLDNTTNSQNAVEVTIPDASLLLDPVTDGQLRRWRIYRTDTSGDYPDTALVHEVVETVNETFPYGPLVSTWIDDGSPLLEGSPLLVSTTFNPPESAATGVTAGATGYTPTAPLTATDVQDALDQVAGLLSGVGTPGGKVQVQLSVADITAGGWGAGEPFAQWVVPAAFDGWIVDSISAGLTAALSVGSVQVYMVHAVKPTVFGSSSDNFVLIDGAGATAYAEQFGEQDTPYTSAHTVAKGDLISGFVNIVGSITPATPGATLTVALRSP